MALLRLLHSCILASFVDLFRFFSPHFSKFIFFKKNLCTATPPHVEWRCCCCLVQWITNWVDQLFFPFKLWIQFVECAIFQKKKLSSHSSPPPPPSIFIKCGSVSCLDSTTVVHLPLGIHARKRRTRTRTGGVCRIYLVFLPSVVWIGINQMRPAIITVVIVSLISSGS